MNQSRKRVSIGVALLVGVALGALPGPAVLHAADVRGNQKQQGKEGDLCNSSSDCQQKPTALSCVAVGNQKQCTAPARPIVVPPT